MVSGSDSRPWHTGDLVADMRYQPERRGTVGHWSAGRPIRLQDLRCGRHTRKKHRQSETWIDLPLPLYRDLAAGTPRRSRAGVTPNQKLPAGLHQSAKRHRSGGRCWERSALSSEISVC